MNHGCTLILDAFWVDNKRFPTMQHPNVGEGRFFYDYYEGEARHLGWMDLCLLKSVIQKHSINHIILQNLDTLGKIAQHTMDVKVCVSYEHNHFIVKSIPQGKEKEFLHSEPIYASVEVGGWDYSVDDDEIPYRAQQYMRFLLVHTRVNSITTMTNKVKVTAYFDMSGQVHFKSDPNS